jgi:hypothetical protein
MVMALFGHEPIDISSVYIGGGTPSLSDPQLLTAGYPCWDHIRVTSLIMSSASVNRNPDRQIRQATFERRQPF